MSAKSKNGRLSRRQLLKLAGGLGVAAGAAGVLPEVAAGAAPAQTAGTSRGPESTAAYEVDQPTYVKDIVGDITRYDERMRAFSRATYVAGDGFYEKFYALYPELKGTSEELAPYTDPPPVKAQRAGLTLAGFLLSSASIQPPGFLADDKIVQPQPSAQQVPVDAADMAHRIKELGLALGAAVVRIGPLNPNWIYTTRGQGKTDPHWGEPVDLTHKSAISMAFRQDYARMANSSGPASAVEVGKAYTQMATAAVSMALAIAQMGYPVRAHHLRNYLILQVPVAIDAGMGELGRNGYVVNRDLGTNFRLVTVTTDLPMTYDKPVDFGLQAFCENCKLCATSCPAQSISTGDKVIRRGVKVWDIDEVKCLRFWGTNGVSCSVCQTSCPWSKQSSWVHGIGRDVASLGGGAAGTVMSQLETVLYGDRENAPTPDWLA